MDSIEDLLKDDLRGATAIFRDALKILLRYEKPEEIQTDVERLKDQFSAMGLFQNLSREIRTLNDTRDMHRFLNHLSQKLDTDTDRVLAIAGEHISDNCRITTISNSSYVRDLILSNRQKVDIVYCLRSGPRYEGENLADLLLNNEVAAKIIPDSDYRAVLKNTGLVLVGSDLISDTFFINKKGTKNLVEYGHDSGIRVCVLGDTLRYVPGFVCNKLPADFEMIPIKSRYHICM